MLNLRRYPYFAYDTETTGLEYPTDQAFGLSVSTPDGQHAYYDIREEPEIITWLNDEMRDYRGTIICHNASFDYKMSHRAGIQLPIECLDDTLIRAVMINEHLRSYSLDDLARKYLGERKQDEIYKEMAELFGGLATRNVQMARIAQAPVEVVRPYAIRDTQLTIKLWERQREQIEADGLHKICQFERSLIPTVIRTEMHGIRVDLDEAERARGKLTPKINDVQRELDKIAGKEFNSNSTPQIRDLFRPTKQKDGVWVACDETPCGQTPAGNPSINAEVLRKMRHPAAKLILEIRSLIKTRDTFLGKHILGHAINGRVYPNINQNRGEDAGTITGRFSYSNPAMQQIPSRNKEVAKIVKPCFLPDDGHVWLDADLNSFEVRIFAHLVNNENIIQAYYNNPGLDFHQFVADITDLPRNATYSGEANAKQLNLSMIFNSGNGAIADKMGLPWEWDEFEKDGQIIRYKKPGREAMEVINRYHRRVRGVRDLASGCQRAAIKRGYVRTFTGRRLRFPDKRFTYKASGLLIQATSADVNKMNWLKIEEALNGRGRMILNTHDSYSMSIPEEHRDGIWKDVKGAVESHDLRVPILLDYNGTGHNWWGALTGELDEKA